MCFSDIVETMRDGIATAYTVVTYYRKLIYIYIYIYLTKREWYRAIPGI